MSKNLLQQKPLSLEAFKMRLYNTLTRKIEDFIPQDPKNVKIYTCGPTVYSFAHIGNYAAYIYWDLLIRAIKLHHWTPNRVMNLTDVGHLTSDGDDGDDKLEKGAKKENKTVWEIADFYSAAFLKDYSELNLLQPTKIARATDYIKQDIKFVEELSKKGFTYEITDGIYFDTSKFKNYANFARLDLENLKAGARVEYNPEKRHASDFAVWKFIQDGEDHAMRWDFLGRPGYPGWHLECSVISHTELGEPLDIHTGGIDHIPVHHTNEIAQTEAALNTTMSRFWLHCNFITSEGQKFSKSLGNAYTLSELKTKDFSPLDYKLWVLQGHYQSERNFTLADLKSAQIRRLKWKNQIAELLQSNHNELIACQGSSKLTDFLHSLLQKNDTPKTNLSRQMLEYASDNLNSAEAFSYIDQHPLSLDDWALVEQLFGLGLFEQTLPSQEVINQIEARDQARQQKDFQTADRLRAQIEQAGFVVKDNPNQSIWQYYK